MEDGKLKDLHKRISLYCNGDECYVLAVALTHLAKSMEKDSASIQHSYGTIFLEVWESVTEP